MFEKLIQYTKEVKPTLKNELNSFFDERISLYKNQCGENEYYQMLLDLKEITTEYGKMIRPTLALCTSQMISEKEVSSDEIKACAAFELLHKFLLIHDDIIDDARVRYNALNLFGKYEDNYKKRFEDNIKSAERYGISISLIGGDLDLSFVYELILETNLSNQLKLALIKEIGRTMFWTASGWRGEYESTFKPLDQVSEEDVMRNITFITGEYTGQGPLRYGAILSDKATDEEVNMIGECGLNLGTAFQIKDDLLELFGEVETTGQSSQSDLEEGKKTLHIVCAFDKSSIEDKKFLLRKVGSRDISREDLQRIREIVDKTGAKEYAQSKALEIVNKALEILNSTSYQNGYKEVLKDLAHFIIEREK